MCVCVCIRACVRSCMHACVRAQTVNLGQDHSYCRATVKPLKRFIKLFQYLLFYSSNMNFFRSLSFFLLMSPLKVNRETWIVLYTQSRTVGSGHSQTFHFHLITFSLSSLSLFFSLNSLSFLSHSLSFSLSFLSFFSMMSKPL